MDRLAPQASHRLRDQPAGALLVTRRGLELDVQRMAVAQDEGGDAVEARQRLAGEDASVPAAGIQQRQLGPVQLEGGAGRVGGALERVVVQQEGQAVGAEAHVALEGTPAQAGAQAHRGQRVLRGVPARTPVREPQRIGPGSGRRGGLGFVVGRQVVMQAAHRAPLVRAYLWTGGCPLQDCAAAMSGSRQLFVAGRPRGLRTGKDVPRRAKQLLR